MAYIPSCPSPYMTAVDLSVGKTNTFSCLINPRDVIRGYTVKIKSVFSGSEIISKSEIFQTPLYGSANNDCYLNVDITFPEGTEESTNCNGEDYSWSVTLVDDDYEEVKYGGYTGEKGFLLQDYKFTNEQNKLIDCVLCVNEKFYTITGFKTTDIVLCEPKELFEKDAWAWAEANPNATMRLYKNKTTSPEYYFKARDKAVVTFDVPQQIASSIIDISATYSQAQKVKPSYYCFNLYNGDELIHTTNDVVSSNISYHYDGLLSGEIYSLELKIVDDDSVETVIEKSFQVEYTTYDSFIEPKITADNYNTCLDVDFSQYVKIDGVLEGNDNVLSYAKYKTGVNADIPQDYNAIQLSSEQNIYWDRRSGDKPLNLEYTEQLLHWHGHEGFHGNIIEKDDETELGRNIKIGFDGKNFYRQFGYTKTTYMNNGASFPYSKDATAISKTDIATPSEDTWYYISDTDEISDTDYIIENDLTNKYWWLFFMDNDSIKISQSTKYSDTVVD